MAGIYPAEKDGVTMARIQFVMVPGDILSKPDISLGAKLMYGRVRIFSGEINTEYVANDLGLTLDEAVRYLHELVRLKLVEENRLDAHSLFLLSSSINKNKSSFFYKVASSVPKEEEKKEESSKALKEEEEKKNYLPPAEAAAKLRELSVMLKMKKKSAAGRVSPDESRERQKQAMRSIIECEKEMSWKQV